MAADLTVRSGEKAAPSPDPLEKAVPDPVEDAPPDPLEKAIPVPDPLDTLNENEKVGWAKFTDLVH